MNGTPITFTIVYDNHYNQEDYDFGLKHHVDSALSNGCQTESLEKALIQNSYQLVLDYLPSLSGEALVWFNLLLKHKPRAEVIRNLLKLGYQKPRPIYQALLKFLHTHASN